MNTKNILIVMTLSMQKILIAGYMKMIITSMSAHNVVTLCTVAETVSKQKAIDISVTVTVWRISMKL